MCAEAGSLEYQEIYEMAKLRRLLESTLGGRRQMKLSHDRV
jgi:hypothetical protein